MRPLTKMRPFKAGVYQQNFSGKEYSYRSFPPNFVNCPYAWSNPSIPGLLEDAMRMVGELNAYSKLIPEYYDALTFVRERNDMDQWILFFLTAVITTAKKSIDIFGKIIALREQYENRILELGRRAKPARKLLLMLFSAPVVTAAQAAAHLKVSIGTANTLVNILEQYGLLKEITGYSRNRVFVLHKYVNLFME